MAAHSHLPHWQRPGKPCFLTWRLADSLPVTRIADLWTNAGAKFIAFDRLLDARSTGPQWLKHPAVAEAVVSALANGQQNGFHELGAWVIMPNHVHVLIWPLIDLDRIVRGVKAKSAKDANHILNRTGSFWARDYFDRFIRNSDGEQRVTRYIENNPVKAGLCREPGAWPFSSASPIHRNAAASRVSPVRV